MSTHYNPAEVQKNGVTWIISAGVFAVLLAGFLWFIDDSMTNSPTAVMHDEDLKALRQAQAGLNSGMDDSRMYEAGHHD